MKTTAACTTLMLALCLPTVGCSDAQAPSKLAAQDDVVAPTQDTTQPDSDADADADATQVDTVCSDPSALDTPDPQGQDSNCDGADGTVGVDVYLDPNVGDDSNIGSPKQPVETLDRAIEIAASRQGVVLVAGGVFATRALTLESNLTIVGGYDATFMGERKRHRTTFEAGAEGWRIESSGSVELHSLTVSGADAQAAKPGHGGSTYALVLDVTQAVIEDVDLQAGDAQSGIGGKSGSDGARGSDASGASWGTGLECLSISQPRYARGAAAAESNADGQPAGDLDSATPPEQGQAGFKGSDGTNASGVPSLDEGWLSFGAAIAGQGDGTPGHGGPGGGGNNDCVHRGEVAYRISGGGGGSGGCPGLGGMPGSSGGGAVALLVRRGSVSVQASRVATGFAGSGGDGGPGGEGGDGGRGGVPDVGEYQHTCVYSGEHFAMPEQCIRDPLKLNCAAYGAAGGKGGDGGHGGGGAGGWTIGVLTVGEATADVDSATQLDLGKPGLGGMGGITRAPDGQKTPSYHIEL